MSKPEEASVYSMYSRKPIVSDLSIGVLGIVVGFGFLAISATLYIAVAMGIGWGVSHLFGELAPGERWGWILLLVGIALLVIDLFYIVFRPGSFRKMARGLYADAPGLLIKDLEAEDARAVGAKTRIRLGKIWVRSYLIGLTLAMVMFECLYAAMASSGAQSLFTNPLFNETTEAGVVVHYLFWLAQPLDVFLLDAPSYFGFSPSALTPNQGYFPVLLGVFLFKTLLVATVVKLMVELIRFDPVREGLTMDLGEHLPDAPDTRSVDA